MYELRTKYANSSVFYKEVINVIEVIYFHKNQRRISTIHDS